MKSQPTRTLAGLAIAALVVIATVMGAIKWFAAERLPTLDAVRFATARSDWTAERPPNYRITIEVTGRQPATYTAVVRDGRPLSASRDGQPLKDQRTFATWTVDGMFNTMEYDVDRNAEAASDPPLHLGARFDERWHFPAEYLRIEWGTSMEVAWQVIDFTLLDVSKDATAL